MPDARQLSVLIWVVIAILFGLRSADLRASAVTVLKAFLNPAISTLFGVYTLWLVVVHRYAWSIELWNADLLSESLLWYAAAGVTLLFRINNLGQSSRFFRDQVVDTIKTGAIVEFLINVRPLSLLGELVLQPLLLILLTIGLVSKRDEKLATAGKIANLILALVGLGLVAYTASFLVREWSELDAGQLMREFALPVWLTLGALPIVYALALVLGYESLFSIMKAVTGQKRLHWRAKLGVASAIRGRVRELHTFRHPQIRQAARATSIKSARAAVFEARKARQRKVEAEQARTMRTSELTGIKGTDESGRQLDQREFAESRAALLWLATCHMGHYRNLGYYRPDLMTIVDNFDLQGLPAKHGVTMLVHEDGQAWYAYRRLITGWVLGIGAAGKPPDQWLYSGQDEPTHFPSHSPGWVEGAKLSPPDWT